MLVIRLRRIGRKKDPHYRLVVTEHTSPVQGKFIAEVGHFHPKSKELKIHKDKLIEWLDKGAMPSNTVSKLCVRDGITHKLVTVTQEHSKPKKKAQEMVQAKADKAANPVPAPEPKTTEEPTEAPSPDQNEDSDAPEEEAITSPEEPATESDDTVEAPAEDTEPEAEVKE